MLASVSFFLILSLWFCVGVLSWLYSSVDPVPVSVLVFTLFGVDSLVRLWVGMC